MKNERFAKLAFPGLLAVATLLTSCAKFDAKKSTRICCCSHLRDCRRNQGHASMQSQGGADLSLLLTAPSNRRAEVLYRQPKCDPWSQQIHRDSEQHRNLQFPRRIPRLSKTTPAMSVLMVVSLFGCTPPSGWKSPGFPSNLSRWITSTHWFIIR